MAKDRNVGIIGHFGGKENFLDGQTVKTKILYEELKNATNWKFVLVDTYYKKKNPLKLIFQTLHCLFSCKDIFVSLSGNGMRMYFPILSFFAKFGKRIYHDVIGGNLALYVVKYPKFKKYLNSFVVNWVETKKTKKELIDIGIINVEVIPNFKRLSIIENPMPQSLQKPYKFCTFSRVMKEKGIETAIETIETINRIEGETICTLDIYGPIDEKYKSRFTDIIKTVSNNIQYCGTVPFNKSVEKLQSYFALLFPTYWDGEGFAGTIVDALTAGIPVIATDWNCNAEIIEDGKNGIIYPNQNIRTLKDAIEWMIQNVEVVLEMKAFCIESAKQYQPEQYIKKIIQKVEHSNEKTIMFNR